MSNEHSTETDEEPPQTTAKSAEDRKAAAALSKLDARDDSDVSASARQQVDQEAVKNAMSGVAGGGQADAQRQKQLVAKKVKVDAADVALLVAELDMSKARATDLLKAHDGDAVRAMRAFVEPTF